ncbi:MAG TPA: MFS transporter [Dehalococcoidia bacterium]|nr:MFS transporter [Dehalococcoidia bacterium]
MKQVSLPWMIIYGAARFGIGIHDIFFNAVAGLYLASYGLPNVAIGFLANERSFIGSVLQPLAGAASDRLRSPIGRRKPFMFLIIPAILGFLLLMHRPQVWLAVLIFVLAPFFLGLAVTAYEVLLPDCVLPRQRGTVNGVNRALGYVGGMGFLVLAFMFWEEAPWAIFLLVAVGLGVGFLTTMVLVQEPPAPQEEAPGSFQPLAYIRDILSFREAAKYVASYFFFWVGIGGVTPFITRFGHQELGIPENETFLLLLAVMVSTLITAVPAGWLGDKVGKKRVSLWGLLAFGLIILVSSQLVTKEQAIVALTVAGIAQAVPTVLAYPMFTEIVPARRMGELSGMSTMIWSLAQPLGATVFGSLADATGSLRIVLMGGGAALLISWVLLMTVQMPEQSSPQLDKRPVAYTE